MKPLGRVLITTATILVIAALMIGCTARQRPARSTNPAVQPGASAAVATTPAPSAPAAEFFAAVRTIGERALRS